VQADQLRRRAGKLTGGYDFNSEDEPTTTVSIRSGQVAWTLWFAGCTAAEVSVTGNSRRNVDPLLSLDSTQMRPPMRLTSSLQM
jgi:hypothetical protein